MSTMTPILSLFESNKIIESMIDANKPFSISRIGDSISTLALAHLYKKQVHPRVFVTMATHDGIYHSTKEQVNIFAKCYNIAVLYSDAMACFDGLYADRQNEYLRLNPKPSLHFEVLEPYYCIEKGIVPWTHKLVGKKILIISPFVDTFKKQVDKGFHFYGSDAPDNKRMFHKEQQFVYYKSYNTLAGNNIHSSWHETFNIMCDDIKQLDFDIALLSCGGYGMPLCNFIKLSLNKSAVYMGGSLQLLFGVNGKRWENHEPIKTVSSLQGNQWTWPSSSETIPNNSLIEQGCYWK
jgi:hypothetical protein